MLLVIDNYDSFVYNLARYCALAGWKNRIVRNDEIDLAEIESMKPEAIVLSPGPCTPNEAGICVDLIKTFGQKIPILGVCLGHQCIAHAYGDEIVRALSPVHGKASLIRHENTALFEGMPQEFEAGRYHSLTTKISNNSPLRVTAWHEREVMAFEHKNFPVYGVQFHPESILTPYGMKIIENFTQIVRRFSCA